MRRSTLLALALAVPLAVAGQPNKENGTVLTAKRALMLADPQIVVGQNVQTVEVSPDGRYLVAVRFTPNPAPPEIGGPQPEPLRKDIVVWDSATGTTKEIPLSKDTNVFPRFQWFVGTDRAIVSVAYMVPVSVNGAQRGAPPPATITNETFVLDASDAKLQSIRKASDHGMTLAQFDVSPVSPLAVEIDQPMFSLGDQTPPVTIRTTNADGSFGKSATLPNKYSRAGRTEWSADARELLIEIERPPDSGGAPIKVVVHYDPVSGDYSETIGPVASYEPKKPESDVRLDYKFTDATEGSATARVLSWWISSTTDSERPVALVSEHAEYAVLPAGERYVAFMVKGALFVRRTIEISVQQYKEMMLAAKRAAAMSKAKQVALGLIMYSADNDDAIPGDLDLRKDVSPYVRNDSVFDGFVYTFQGGKLSDLKDPANTVLGYTDTPDGRAVAYADGHVVWKNPGA